MKFSVTQNRSAGNPTAFRRRSSASQDRARGREPGDVRVQPPRLVQEEAERRRGIGRRLVRHQVPRQDAYSQIAELDLGVPLEISALAGVVVELQRLFGGSGYEQVE